MRVLCKIIQICQKGCADAPCYRVQPGDALWQSPARVGYHFTDVHVGHAMSDPVDRLGHLRITQQWLKEAEGVPNVGCQTGSDANARTVVMLDGVEFESDFCQFLVGV